MEFQINNTPIFDCLSSDKCLELCKEQSFKFHYEFVWFFVVAFLFQCLSYISFYQHWITPENNYKLLKALNLASYMLNMAGVAYYLYFLR